MRQLAFKIYRRDLLGANCIVCGLGIYSQSYPDPDKVWCQRCLDTVPRWLTKKDIMELRGEELK